MNSTLLKISNKLHYGSVAYLSNQFKKLTGIFLALSQTTEAKAIWHTCDICNKLQPVCNILPVEGWLLCALTIHESIKEKKNSSCPVTDHTSE